MNRKEALKLVETKWWEKATSEQIVSFQLYEDRLCCPFGVFHEAIEKVLGRSVWTHEFGLSENLQREYEGKDPKPTLEDTLRWIKQKFPHLKTVFVEAKPTK